MRLHDTHCHLDSASFTADLDEILARAREASVARMTTIGCATSVEDLAKPLEIARAMGEHVSASLGVHPHDASAFSDALEEKLSTLVADSRVVAVGETGLDFHYDHSPREIQRQVFRRTIAIARQIRKPLVVHTRSAPQDTLAILKEERAHEVGGIIHCFSEDWSFAKASLDLGFVCSFSGIVTFKKSTDIQEAARNIPADSYLIETDAPYLAPVPKRGKRNEPAFVAHTASFLAELRGVNAYEVAEQTYRNAARVFGLDSE